MLESQKDKFKLPEEVTYLNGAYMSPSLKSVELAGHQAVSQKCLPFEIKPVDFFTDTKKLKALFAELVTVPDPQNIAVIPSVSYGIATVAKNIPLEKGDEILIVGEQFPSNVYSWQRIADQNEAKISIVSAPTQDFVDRGKNWNAQILASIHEKTKVVAMPHIHWSDGTLFDLKAIRKKTKEYNALLIIDGTQSIGALPFSVEEIQPDALICAGYKWLLGPYAIGLAYYSDELCKGIPIEENWINRKQSEDFTNLVSYENKYQPKAGRFNVGEMSNFTLTPMLIKAIAQLLEWKPMHIQEYCAEISRNAIAELKELGCFIEDVNYRSSHLFGIYLPEGIATEEFKNKLIEENIYVSFRGNAVRVSSHVYNTQKDFEKLVHCFKSLI
ncbi:aminotransferase class V-fold PLP-dependent enzyme [Kordia sp. YSTF-M3]|uniref:Aminotransferase class V-fold PLP-dependent enzyme n=2 Tax=Kordia aestuariivivens TaxID=2759037 RepID=A0ABR7Q3F0_9FLAO|nr:aminotransferase class V-fold PLP-dependent enzyme [Kordia aestuariivivens]